MSPRGASPALASTPLPRGPSARGLGGPGARSPGRVWSPPSPAPGSRTKEPAASRSPDPGDALGNARLQRGGVGSVRPPALPAQDRTGRRLVPREPQPGPRYPSLRRSGVSPLALPGLCPRRGVARRGPGGAGPALRAEREGRDGSVGRSGGSGGRRGGPGADRALTTSVRAETRWRAPCAGRVLGLVEPPAPPGEGQAALGSARWARRPPFTPSAKAGSRGLFFFLNCSVTGKSQAWAGRGGGW